MFLERGYCLIDDFLTPQECEKLLLQIADFRRGHELKRIVRKVKERSLDYFVIDGNQIKADLPDVVALANGMNSFVNELDTTELIPLRDGRAALNVNITPPGGEYRWHYDRNRVTSLLYLNNVGDGEIEFCPRFRIKFPMNTPDVLQEATDSLLRQKWMRKVFAKTVRVPPRPGRLLIMRGDICLHSVRPVTGHQWRFNLVMAYDSPENTYSKNAELDTYLYD